MRNVTVSDSDLVDKVAELLARAKALGWRGQNDIARQIGVNAGHFSRAIRGQHKTRDEMIERAERAIADAERGARRSRSKRRAS